MFPPRNRLSVTSLAIIAAALTIAPVNAQQTRDGAASAPVPALSSYADVADLAVDSATIIDARIRRASPVPPAQQVGIPPQLVRMYVEADVNTVIFGSTPVARRVGYLVDQPRRADGRAPRLNRQRVLLFARPVATANRLQLIGPQAQLAWDAGRDATVRSIVAERAAGAVPPAITSVAQAFHVAGTVAGESETQIFLRTASGDPVSLTILRRPGQTPRWAVAFGEIVDESATVPARRTLGWYRLACGLPPALPATALSAMASEEAQAATLDYRFVLRSLGACDRSPPVPVPAPQG
jgi:hypothetical protein